jgi:hypothetical protein
MIPRSFSRLAPSNPRGPGTTAADAFKVVSIPHGYAMLDRLRFTAGGSVYKVKYERLGSARQAGFSDPVDHYILYIDDAPDASVNGRLMDFYVFAYARSAHDESDLPVGFSVFRLSEAARRDMDRMLEENPAMKEAFERQALLQVNMARMQRGLPPLSRLPSKGGCALILVGILAGAGAVWALFT